MKRMFFLLFLLAIVNCFGLTHEARLFLGMEDGATHVNIDASIEKFLTIIEQIEETYDNELQKTIFKTNLSTEFRLIEKCYEFYIQEAEKSDNKNDKWLKTLNQKLAIIRFIFEQAKQL